MIKKTITFDDLDGNPVTRDFYFNLSPAEVAELEVSVEGGFSEMLVTLVNSKNGGDILRTFKDLIVRSIGRRSEDNIRFEKSQEITNSFIQTNAYSELFMELATDADRGAEFVRGIMPAKFQKAIDSGETDPAKILAAAQARAAEPAKSEVEDKRPAYIKENRRPTNEELRGMSPEQIQEAFRVRS